MGIGVAELLRFVEVGLCLSVLAQSTVTPSSQVVTITFIRTQLDAFVVIADRVVVVLFGIVGVAADPRRAPFPRRIA